VKAEEQEEREAVGSRPVEAMGGSMEARAA